MSKNVIDLNDGIKELTRVVDDRNRILEEIDELWMNDCLKCDLIPEAIKRGELHPSMTKSSVNPICSACPVHKAIQGLGKELDDNIRDFKDVRQTVKARYGKNRLVDSRWHSGGQ